MAGRTPVRLTSRGQLLLDVLLTVVVTLVGSALMVALLWMIAPSGGGQ